MEWLNEPPRWHAEGDTITVVTGRDTDFWRTTHYDFVHDTGHLYFQRAGGDFTAEVRFSGTYAALYDQAGLMIRLDEARWIKAGVEYTDGMQQLSVVVTRDYSDWSLLPLDGQPGPIWLRLSRHGEAVRVEYSSDGERFGLVRLAYLGASATAAVGIMACSPQRQGFEARFHGFAVREPLPPELHT